MRCAAIAAVFQPPPPPPPPLSSRSTPSPPPSHNRPEAGCGVCVSLNARSSRGQSKRERQAHDRRRTRGRPRRECLLFGGSRAKQVETADASSSPCWCGGICIGIALTQRDTHHSTRRDSTAQKRSTVHPASNCPWTHARHRWPLSSVFRGSSRRITCQHATDAAPAAGIDEHLVASRDRYLLVVHCRSDEWRRWQRDDRCSEYSRGCLGKRCKRDLSPSR